MEKKRYRTGEFAQKADVSIRTIHFYEKKGLIHPQEIGENGYRYYGEEEFAKLQRILTLKLLGFSLEEIQGLSLNESDTNYLQKSLEMQRSLVRKKIEQLKTVEQSLQNATHMMEQGREIGWEDIARLIRTLNVDRELVEQYQNEKNLEARNALHNRFSRNSESWFCWIYNKMRPESGMRVLELGCGNGKFWVDNAEKLPEGLQVLLTDRSPGMLEDTRKNLADQVFKPKTRESISSRVLDCHNMEELDGQFDFVMANHVMFYLRDINKALSEIVRVLKPGGRFICATYGKNHMREIEELAQEFNSHICLSRTPLYENFGLENGEELLREYFSEVEWHEYPDELLVTDEQMLMDYMLSCHGNQREYLVPAYEEFRAFLKEKLKEKGGVLRITKQAGIFIASNQKRRNI